MSRHRNWVFTLNNWEETDWALLQELCEFNCNKLFVYMIFGFEKAPTTGTPHLQGYFVFTDAKTKDYCIHHLSHRARFRSSKGNSEQNFVYCSEDGDFYEFGDRPLDAKTKKKGVTEDVITKLNNGCTLDEIRIQYPAFYFHHQKKLAEYVQMPVVDTQFFRMSKEEFEPINLSNETLMITNLSQIMLKPNAKYIFYVTDFIEDEVKCFPRNGSVRYREGYQWKEITPERFTIVNNEPHVVRQYGYKKYTL